MKISQVLFFCFAMNLTLAAQEQQEVLSILKINLTDFSIGQYTIGYERLLGTDCSLNASFSGVGYGHDLRITSMGDYYDESGEWFRIQGEMEAEVQGFATSLGVRKYSGAVDSRPRGFFGGAVAQWRRCSSKFTETLDEFEPFSEVFGLQYPMNVSHTATIQSFGMGVELGYHLFAENGLSLDIYGGPIFRFILREAVFEDLPDSEEEAWDGLEDRFRDYYYGRPQLSDLYLGRTGSWFRAGITLGFQI